MHSQQLVTLDTSLPCSTLRYMYHFTGKVQSVKILMLSGRCTYEGVIVKVSYFPYI